MHCSLFQRNFVQKTSTLAFHKDVPLHRPRASLRQPTPPSDTMNTIRQILQPTLISFCAPALSVPFRCEICEQLWTLTGRLIWPRTRKLHLSLSMLYSDMKPFTQATKSCSHQYFVPCNVNSVAVPAHCSLLHLPSQNRVSG